jgi:hypothetical protein
MNRTDFQTLAEARVEDAQVLFNNGRFAAAKYLAGYSVECALKACIAKLTKAGDFPPPAREVSGKVYVHDLETLLGAAGLERAFKDLFRSDLELGANWGVVAKWKQDSRYKAQGKNEAEDLLNAIVDPRHGILSCIRRYW